MAFINYDNQTGITVKGFRNNGATSGSIEEFIDSLIREEDTNISVKHSPEFLIRCKRALEDGEFLANAGYDDYYQERIENAYVLVEIAIKSS